MKNIKLMIAVPSGQLVHADFAMCLANMMTDLAQPISGIRHQFTIVNVKTSILPKSREHLAEVAVENDATHVLFIDSDMVFPPETFRGLIRHDVSVVAANCATKTFPSFPTARLFRPDDPAGHPVQIYPKEGLIRVWRVGCGVMLVATEVFRTLPKPWFNTRWEPKLKDHVGEDWVFCENLEAAGYDIFVDQELSEHIGHIGSYTFGVHNHAPTVQIATEMPK